MMEKKMIEVLGEERIASVMEYASKLKCEPEDIMRELVDKGLLGRDLECITLTQ